ncbi:hypothetical protein [Roseomonas chloroacetimidivorans]|uniref:hypothetical protein n=1 Tax=Roseomonas chloroacetimidivorans TaxID=1766656 RepID=UPI003C75E1A7
MTPNTARDASGSAVGGVSEGRVGQGSGEGGKAAGGRPSPPPARLIVMIGCIGGSGLAWCLGFGSTKAVLVGWQYTAMALGFHWWVCRYLNRAPAQGVVESEGREGR